MAYLQQQTEIDQEFPVHGGRNWSGWAYGTAWRLPRPAGHQAADQIADAVGVVGLLDQLDRRIGELSVGQMRRALFAAPVAAGWPRVMLGSTSRFAAIDARTREVFGKALMARWHVEGTYHHRCHARIRSRAGNISPPRCCWRAARWPGATPVPVFDQRQTWPKAAFSALYDACRSTAILIGPFEGFSFMRIRAGCLPGAWRLANGPPRRVAAAAADGARWQCFSRMP